MTDLASDRRETAHLPGDGHMWVMVLGDLVIFGAYFVIFMVYRAMQPHEFLAAQQQLNINAGVLNTLVLLTSSWFVARSVLAARAGDHRRAIALTYLGGACGVLFLLIKAYEWTFEIRHGYTLASNTFFSFYYMLTGVHLFHVALGLLILGIVVRELRNPRRRRASMVESGATYWHMVDLLWIVIFGLLYVMR
ncbi:cytochrome c oxidase subunit 3 [Mycobacterium talmoniae]|uniref:Probable cytochrome c oxidase subunit 3 n=1 Tax=Mycobacterium talmoniae TaxID=1858794 RepID=A0A1S1N680_9MYCO|nr:MULTISPECIES: cytochrome c oxidase subunit 3 [Mycobacterium]OHU93756.1 cytochrome C oxidase subunit III [Mycobacterium talmoniae]PQM44590.1 putative cytochrome c oxidase subunit 3 [Mycobacterium talmoniae]TDH51529.1 cytochrome c oxidase subunit 3 family protein [Mycobacterium eburneum]